MLIKLFNIKLIVLWNEFMLFIPFVKFLKPNRRPNGIIKIQYLIVRLNMLMRDNFFLDR